jgi:hypothetical protein
VVAAIAAASLIAIPTGQADPGPLDTTGSEFVVFNVNRDGSQTVVSDTISSNRRAVFTGRGSAASTAVRTRPARAAATQCSTMGWTRIGRSAVFGTVLWKFTQYVSWCWDGVNVTSVQRWTEPCCVGLTWSYAGVVSSSGSYYMWCCGNPRSGHWGYRKGQFNQSVPPWGIVDSAYPWIKIWVHRNGSWAHSSGED